MEKKMVGILAGVAAIHVVALAGLMASGGCRQPAILGTQTYNDGPAMEKVPSAQEAPPPAALVPQSTAPEVQTQPSAPAAAAPKAPPALTSVPPAQKTAAAAAAGETTYKVVKGDSLSRIAYKHGLKTKELAAYNNLDLKSTLKVGQELKIPAGGAYAAPAPQSDKSAAKPADGKSGASARSDAKSGAKAKPAALPADGIHVVAAGESLERIGRKYGVSAKAIADENNIAMTKVLHVGDKLRIPARSAAKKTAAAKSGSKKAATKVKTPALTTDDLDPDLPLSGEKAAAKPAESAAQPAAAAVSAPEQTSLLTNTESLQVQNDMTVEEFCRQYSVKIDDLKRLNPDLAADGKLKGGSFLIVPRL